MYILYCYYVPKCVCPGMLRALSTEGLTLHYPPVDQGKWTIHSSSDHAKYMKKNSSFEVRNCLHLIRKETTFQKIFPFSYFPSLVLYLKLTADNTMNKTWLSQLNLDLISFLCVWWSIVHSHKCINQHPLLQEWQELLETWCQWEGSQNMKNCTA